MTLGWCLALTVGAFVFTRLPFVVDWRLPLAFPDTATYLWPVEALEGGDLPLFDLRTPGYPIFWWLCRQISHDILFVIAAQMLISAGVATTAVILMARHAPPLVVPTTVALAIFVTGNAHLMWDVTVLSESVFTSAMIAWMLFLFLALHTRRFAFFLLTSIAAAVAVSVRPSAVHLVAISIVVAGWCYRRRFGMPHIAALLAPVVAVVAMLVIYNQRTIGVAALSGGSTWAYLWSTTLYLDPDPGLSADINAAMAAKNAALSPADRAAIYDSSNPRLFRDALERNIGAGIGQIAERITGWPTRTGWRYMHHRRDLQQAVRVSIARRPSRYLLNMAGTFVDCFRFITVPHPNYYTAFPATDLYRDAFVSPPFYVRNLGGYYNPAPPPHVRVERDGATGAATVVAPDSRLARMYGPFSDWRSRLFENALWGWAVPVGAIAVLAAAIRARRVSPETVAWLACVAAVGGNACMAALIGHTEPRYAQPMHIVNYLAFALAPAFVNTLGGRDA